MKISVLTFSKEDNFGANLQCYALLKTLTSMGHQVDIIDIQLPLVKMGLISRLTRIGQHYNFMQFRRKYFNSSFTKKYKSANELENNPPVSDMYIVGSDQVWNPAITRRLDPLIYFFSFLPSDACRISYAASFGSSAWNDEKLLPRVSELIKKFSAVSVREAQGIKICREIFHINAIEVCDPTFLVPDYDDVCGKYDKNKETDNIIYFKFVRNKRIENIIEHYAKSGNKKYIKLLDFHKTRGSVIKPYVSVKRWLEYIRYSNMVITDSFHCMVFSILFHRQFIVLPSMKTRSGRMKNLLDKLNLSERFCVDEIDLSSKIDYLMSRKIDYKSIQPIIEDMRFQSLSFLSNAISVCEKDH